MEASLHRMTVAQLIKLTIVLFVFFIPLSLFAQTNNDVVTTESYNGVQYIIEETPDVCYYVINSAYSTFEDNSTREKEYQGETRDEMLERVSYIDRLIYRTALNVIDQGNISMGNLAWSNLDIYCFFDAKTKDLAGVGFMFDTEVKHYMTLERLNLLEKTLLDAKINAGETNLNDNNAKFFLVVIKVDL